jgi:hypothetical protein
MSWVALLWPMAAAVLLPPGPVHGIVWWQDRAEPNGPGGATFDVVQPVTEGGS